ncbi:MAG: histidinol-phosphatase HisJ family protein [Oscillospiraceae bacterium]|nr:histidinol-phosphatase HisJ family protein [Oscillospiraceae bacterium]
MIIDCHTHTRNSFDADNDTVIERCERAIQLGLDAMAVTDHCEVNRFYEKDHYKIDYEQKYDDYGFNKAFENSMAETTAAKDLYSSKFNLICGLELGQPLADMEVTEHILSDKRLDFVIASMHEMPGHDDFAFLDYSQENVPALLEQDFSEILRIAKWGKFDVLGHITYALRYIQGNQNIPVDMTPYQDTIREIFKAVIENGKGIEINTSGLRQKFGDTFPSLQYIKLYRELGGEILTVGSDSHRTADLAKGIKEGIEIAAQAGFTRIAYFKERKPYFINI